MADIKIQVQSSNPLTRQTPVTPVLRAMTFYGAHTHARAHTHLKGSFVRRAVKEQILQSEEVKTPSERQFRLFWNSTFLEGISWYPKPGMHGSMGEPIRCIIIFHISGVMFPKLE